CEKDFAINWLQVSRENGGEKGIRTLETVPRLHTFQACAFDHSATSPHRLIPGLETPEWPANKPARARRNILIGALGARDWRLFLRMEAVRLVSGASGMAQ